MAKSMHETKTFEKLQEQVKRYSKNEIELSSDNLPNGIVIEDLYGTPVTFTAQELAVYSLIQKLEELLWGKERVWINAKLVKNQKYTVRLFDTLRYWLMAHNKESINLVH